MLALESKYKMKMEFIVADVTSPEGNYLASKYNVDLIPRFFVLDSKGNIVATEVGAQASETLEKDILLGINTK